MSQRPSSRPIYCSQKGLDIFVIAQVIICREQSEEGHSSDIKLIKFLVVGVGFVVNVSILASN